MRWFLIAPLALLLVVAAVSTSQGDAGSGLVVHEWGTFTSLSESDGVALEYRPLDGVSDLPSFVYTTNGAWEDKGIRGHAFLGKGSIVGTVRMETPVIYFYSEKETQVSVSVSFPKGQLTEFYPQVKGLDQYSEINWGRFKVLPAGTPATFPKEEKPSHYYAARETDASPIRVCGDKKTELEKFLFYRGVGSFDLPLSVELTQGSKLAVSERAPAANKIEALVYEREGDRIGFASLTANAEKTSLERPVRSNPRPLAELSRVKEALVKLLAEAGLFEKEAKAMVATWEDTWFEDGLRVLYIVPRAKTDEVLPLTINPAPEKLVRVLVGRAEVATPELRASLLEAARDLRSGSADAKLAARAKLDQKGRFGRAILEKALKEETDSNTRAGIQEVLHGG